MKQVIDLMGNLVSFELKNDEQVKEILGETTKIKGLVTGVVLNLNTKHEVLVKDFDDIERYYLISETSNFKILQIDPELFFENVKSGAIEVDF
jgi:pentose-5-phosphate-3-epimerase